MAREMPAPRMPQEIWAFLFFGLLIGSLVTGVVVVAMRHYHTTAHALVALPTEAERPGGGMVFEGVLEREPSPRESPLGESLAGWAGTVTSRVWATDGPHSVELCTRAELDGLVLRDPGGAWRLPLTLTPSRVARNEPMALSTRRADSPLVLGPTAESDEVPAVMRARCSLSEPRDGATWTYYETRLLTGTQAVFLGCRGGAGLEACRHSPLAGGHLAAGDRAAVVRALLADADKFASLVPLVALAFSLIAGALAYTHLRRYHRLGSEA